VPSVLCTILRQSPLGSTLLERSASGRCRARSGGRASRAAFGRGSSPHDAVHAQVDEYASSESDASGVTGTPLGVARSSRDLRDGRAGVARGGGDPDGDLVLAPYAFQALCAECRQPVAGVPGNFAPRRASRGGRTVGTSVVVPAGVAGVSMLRRCARMDQRVPFPRSRQRRMGRSKDTALVTLAEILLKALPCGAGDGERGCAPYFALATAAGRSRNLPREPRLRWLPPTRDAVRYA
jgi:hypothetical protein